MVLFKCIFGCKPNRIPKIPILFFCWLPGKVPY